LKISLCRSSYRELYAAKEVELLSSGEKSVPINTLVASKIIQ
jgi:Cys-tRNA synthase (O-phospho-L-seryl-tRNA:Cys-tRNA synthase)